MSNDSYSYDPNAARPADAETLRVENEALRRGFTLIPNIILRARGLSRDAKLLYGVLLSYAWQKGSCFPGYDVLMADMQCQREALAKYIKELKTVGLIEVQRRGQGKTSIYTLHDVVNSGSAGLLPDKEPSQAPNTHSQKFENRTSRSSESELPEVRKPNGEEDSRKKTHKKKTHVSNHFESQTQKQNEMELSFSRNENLQNLESDVETARAASQPLAADHRQEFTPLSDVVATRRKKTSQRRSDRSGAAATTIPGSRVNSSKENPSGRSRQGRKGTLADQAPPAIAALIEQFSGEFHDGDHITSNISQAVKLWQSTGMADTTFCSALYTARTKTQKAPGIEKRADGEAGDWGMRNKMPYFFACLRDVLGLRQEASNNS